MIGIYLPGSVYLSHIPTIFLGFPVRGVHLKIRNQAYAADDLLAPDCRSFWIKVALPGPPKYVE